MSISSIHILGIRVTQMHFNGQHYYSSYNSPAGEYLGAVDCRMTTFDAAKRLGYLEAKDFIILPNPPRAIFYPPGFGIERDANSQLFIYCDGRVARYFIRAIKNICRDERITLLPRVELSK